MSGKFQKKSIVIILIILVLLSMIMPVSSEKTMDLNNNISSNSSDDVYSLIEKVNKSLISYYLEKLVSYGPRFTGTDNCRLSAEYIYDEFQASGLDVSYHPWTSLQYSSQNIVGTLAGRDSHQNPIIILCAHYDTTETSPGANDDGSGIAPGEVSEVS